MKIGAGLMLIGTIFIVISNVVTLTGCGDGIIAGGIGCVGCVALVVGAVILNLNPGKGNAP